jgi:hypothetical protein
MRDWGQSMTVSKATTKDLLTFAASLGFGNCLRLGPTERDPRGSRSGASYRSSAKTAPVLLLAWASAAMPL